MVKNLPASAGDADLILELGRCPGKGNSNPLRYSAWKIPWIEEPSGLQSIGLQRVRHDLSDLAAAAAVGFPGSSAGKESACNARDSGSIPGSGRSPGEWIGYPLQYS